MYNSCEMEEERAAWHQQLVDRLTEAVLVLDKSRVIRFANSRAARMAGVQTPEELVGASYHDILRRQKIYSEDGSPAGLSDLPSEHALRRGEETSGRIFAQIDPSGTHHWISVSGFPLERGPSPSHVALFFRDITRRKLRDDKLRFLIESSKVLSIDGDINARLREKTRLLIPQLADWATINVIDAGGKLRRLSVEHRDPEKIPLLERFASLAAGHPDGEVRGVRRVAQTGRPELYERVAAMPATMFSSEQRTLSRLLQPHSAMIVPIKNGEHVLGVLSLAYSDSGRSYGEDDLEFMQEYGHHLAVVIENARLYKEIEKRDKGKDAFLATLSHELRNPLAPIKHSLELMKLRGDGEIAEEVAMIEHQFEHMEKLLCDLLDVSRFTLGKFKLNMEPLDLAALVRTLSAARRPAMGAQAISLSVNLPREAVWISGDAVRIEQVVSNLLHNAEKFTPRGGSISLELRSDERSAYLTVSDTGVGIDESEIESIFERYFQGERTAVHHGSGLGMGLVLVREIARLHGGSVSVHSPGMGAGTSFIVVLPLSKSPPLPLSESYALSAPPRRQNILVVDDNRQAADSLVKLLTLAGYRAEAAYSGEKGLDAFRRFPANCAIVDIGMPDIDGYEVARALRGEGVSARLIALSGYGTEEDKRRARAAGFDEHLTKPVGLLELRKALEAKSEMASVP